jgi:hypothetical protein
MAIGGQPRAPRPPAGARVERKFTVPTTAGAEAPMTDDTDAKARATALDLIARHAR